MSESSSHALTKKNNGEKNVMAYYGTLTLDY